MNELIETINDISEKELAKIIEFETNDEDCKSIQSILTHVVQSGYTYVVEIRKWLGEDLEYRSKMNFQTAKDYKYALKEMFEFNEQLFIEEEVIEGDMVGDWEIILESNDPVSGFAYNYNWETYFQDSA